MSIISIIPPTKVELHNLKEGLARYPPPDMEEGYLFGFPIPHSYLDQLGERLFATPKRQLTKKEKDDLAGIQWHMCYNHLLDIAYKRWPRVPDESDVPGHLKNQEYAGSNGCVTVSPVGDNLDEIFLILAESSIPELLRMPPLKAIEEIWIDLREDGCLTRPKWVKTWEYAR
ncbi:hypothetical protein VKT23_000335 [Stygiomarasmius scandens]|uniref:DUF2778 domain-containing protein n=1 Tax=Marasmiellus scandens TaxID=2682957 RepID=A0ABR1K3S4_9AGAR